MLASTSLLSCNFPTSNPNCNSVRQAQSRPQSGLKVRNFNKPNFGFCKQESSYQTGNYPIRPKGVRQICCCALKDRQSEDSVSKSGVSGGKDVGDGQGRDWSTSVLLLVLWGGLMFYVFNLAPNQTPSMDIYLLKKLLNLKGDDGYKMNEVLVALWYIMGLWPLLYSMLLLPTGRSSKAKVPVWPFLVLSCFGGAYVLLPYFVLWSPPPPPVDEEEIRKWPLNLSESKLTAGITLAAGLGLFAYAGFAGADSWKEFFQYVRGSKFIHVTSLDFTLLSTFAPFWVYNDMTARKWYEKGSWLLPLSLIPFLGPALYVLLRPSLSSMPVSLGLTISDQE
ncbi:unnamed protein product [Rhodiola kirilowii]